MMPDRICIDLPEENTTLTLAIQLSKHVSAGDVVLLSGDIGAGKTFFARCLIQELTGTQDDVPSPTFTLVQTYQTKDFEIWHCDLYRLTSPDEVLELGLEQAFEEALCLIEWPDRLGSAMPTDGLSLHFEVLETGHHKVTINTKAQKWQPVLEQLGA